IVVFDRIRENLFLDRGKMEFGTVINQSINQTLARSINTSLTLILVLVALYFAGPITLRYFILTLLVGTVVGIYSSIFIASPLLLVWQRFSARKE
ncbi:MAG: protein translocase subunit SecF, partial [Patescibacteria group bacterium]